MATYISHSPDETRRLGERLSTLAHPGWVFGLTGDLGTGKTQLVKGFARGLGVQNPVRSPTFALVNEHLDGRLPLFHLDLYRLETSQQILAAGLDEYFCPRDGVSIIEWFERWEGPPPPQLCLVRLLHEGESTRRIDYELPRP